MRPEAAALRCRQNHCDIMKRRPITMFAFLALVVIAVVALIILSAVVHALFSPWLLLVALGVLAFIKFRPRRSHQ
jgi:hypothetical protein